MGTVCFTNINNLWKLYTYLFEPSSPRMSIINDNDNDNDNDNENDNDNDNDKTITPRYAKESLENNTNVAHRNHKM